MGILGNADDLVHGLEAVLAEVTREEEQALLFAGWTRDGDGWRAPASAAKKRAAKKTAKPTRPRKWSHEKAVGELVRRERETVLALARACSGEPDFVCWSDVFARTLDSIGPERVASLLSLAKESDAAAANCEAPAGATAGGEPLRSDYRPRKVRRF
jgi:hypothetical protein